MVRSLSKRERRTHWWKRTSSISIVLRDEVPVGTAEHVELPWHRSCAAATAPTPPGRLEHETVVDAESDLWHATEARIEVDLADDLAANDLAVCVHLS